MSFSTERYGVLFYYTNGGCVEQKNMEAVAD